MLQSSHCTFVLTTNEPLTSRRVHLRSDCKHEPNPAIAQWEPKTGFFHRCKLKMLFHFLQILPSLHTFFQTALHGCCSTSPIFNSVRHVAGNSPCSNVFLIKNLTTTYNLIVKRTLPAPANDVSMETAHGAVAAKWRGFINGSFWVFFVFFFF